MKPSTFIALASGLLVSVIVLSCWGYYRVGYKEGKEDGFTEGFHQGFDTYKQHALEDEVRRWKEKGKKEK